MRVNKLGATGLRSRLSARVVESRNRRSLERYLAECSPAARHEFEVLLTRRGTAA